MIRPILLLLCAAVGLAHEIGTTRVSARFQPDRTYFIEVVTDAASLAAKLDPSAAPERLSDYETLFRRRVQIGFDGAESRPAISYSVSPDAIATIRMTGPVPPDARRFTWTYSWTFSTYSLTIQGSPAAQWLEGGQMSVPFDLTTLPPPLSRAAVAWRYLSLGFSHILPHGLDHMLFVLGLYLLSGRVRAVLWQVSAFTVAHSLTLGLGMYGLVSVPPSIVEPLIALSIAYVAIENIFLSELKSWRVAVVFAFGLLHGLGFAGALKELGLPRSEFVTALFSFNVGVEMGQLAVISAAFLLVGWHCAHRVWYRSRVVVPLSALIACTALFWTIQRLPL